MMDVMRSWLMGITGAAILASIADGLMPEGGVRQVGKLVCGLVLLTAVLSPLAGRYELGMTRLFEMEEYLLEESRQLQGQTEQHMKPVIEQKLSAYSMDKVRQYGVSCEVQVKCEAGEGGIWLPQDVLISPMLMPQEQQLLVQVLTRELGVDASRVIFREGGG